MPRRKGSGRLGPVRSLRLPLALERWFGATLCLRPDHSASSLLLELVHGGLRLAPGYMRRHAAALLALERDGAAIARENYARALGDTFGERYVAHVEAWIQSERGTITASR